MRHPRGISAERSAAKRRTGSESSAMPLVHEHLPRFAELVGHDCAEVIMSCRKIEVESLIGCAALPPHEVLRAMVA